MRQRTGLPGQLRRERINERVSATTELSRTKRRERVGASGQRRFRSPERSSSRREAGGRLMWLLFAFSGPVLWAISTHIDKYLVDKYFRHSDTAVLMVFTALLGVSPCP